MKERRKMKRKNHYSFELIFETYLVSHITVATNNKQAKYNNKKTPSR